MMKKLFKSEEIHQLNSLRQEDEAEEVSKAEGVAEVVAEQIHEQRINNTAVINKATRVISSVTSAENLGTFKLIAGPRRAN